MNRIENIIRKMIDNKKKQDVLLESIIRKTLFTEQTTRVGKITRISKATYNQAIKAGADHAFAVTTRGYSFKDLPSVIASLAKTSEGVASTDDTEKYDPNVGDSDLYISQKDNEKDTESSQKDSKKDAESTKQQNRQDIGPNSRFGTEMDTYKPNPANLNSDAERSKYIYIIGNIEQKRQRINCVVWIMPTSKINEYETYAVDDKGRDIFYASGYGDAPMVGQAPVILMRNFLNKSEKRTGNKDIWKQWYFNQKISELKLPPESWYKFAGRAAQDAISISQVSDEPATPEAAPSPEETKPETDNNESDTEQVKNEKLKSGYTFTGTITKDGKFKSGIKSWPDPTAKGKLILQQGEWELSSDGTNLFKTGKEIYNGPTYELFGRQLYRHSEYYVVDFKVDETQIATQQILDASTNEQYGIFKGTLNQNLRLLTGEDKWTTHIQTDTDGKQFYIKYTYYHLNGKIDQTKQSELIRYDATTNKPYALYKGTVDDNIKPKTGNQYEVINGDLSKTKPYGKFTNGKFN